MNRIRGVSGAVAVETSMMIPPLQINFDNYGRPAYRTCVIAGQCGSHELILGCCGRYRRQAAAAPLSPLIRTSVHSLKCTAAQIQNFYRVMAIQQ